MRPDSFTAEANPALSGRTTLRWREHELILVTIICLAGVAGAVWALFRWNPEDIQHRFGDVFQSEGRSFSYIANVLLPQAGLFALFYFCYFWMNLYILPRLLQAEASSPAGFQLHFSLNARIEMKGEAGSALKRVFVGIFHTFLLILVLGAGWSLAEYYIHQYLFKELDLTVFGIGLSKAAGLVILYILYAAIRENIIRRTQSAIVNAQQVTLINYATAAAVAWFGLFSILCYFQIIEDEHFLIFCLAVLPPSLLTLASNLYWLFPQKKDKKLFRGEMVRKWLLSNLCWCVPFTFYAVERAEDIIPFTLALWVGQLLITSPISWVIYRYWKDRISHVNWLETKLGQSQADIQFLRSQINPHFLFNVLNTLYGTALQEDANRTAGGIQQLGDMMRFMLHENNLDRISMSKEIDYLKNYIALQSLRTESSPSIQIETSIDNIPECQIAPMLFIPFIENAFKHGISLREPSWIILSLQGDGSRIQFELRNSIHQRQGTDPEKGKSGIGMKNVLHRLKLIYPERHEFYMHQDEKEFFVQLVIQL